jgi:hypothetical protein
MNNLAAIAEIDTSLETNFIVYKAVVMSKKFESYECKYITLFFI